MPTDVSGSRLPVGSSQIRSGGWFDERARDRDALLLAAGELVREAVELVGQADELRISGTFSLDLVARLALHLERVGDVLVDVAVRQQLEVLEDAADVAAQLRHARALAASPASGRRRSGCPRSASSSLSSSLMNVDLPEPDGPTRKTHSPLSICSETSRRPTTSPVVDLRDALEARSSACRRGRRRALVLAGERREALAARAACALAPLPVGGACGVGSMSSRFSMARLRIAVTRRPGAPVTARAEYDARRGADPCPRASASGQDSTQRPRAAP